MAFCARRTLRDHHRCTTGVPHLQVARPFGVGCPHKNGEFPIFFGQTWSAIRPKGALISARDRLGEVKICSAVYQTPAAALGKPPGPAGEPQHAKNPHEKIGWGWASGGAGQRGPSCGKATWKPSIGQPGCWGELILVSRRPGRPVES